MKRLLLFCILCVLHSTVHAFTTRYYPNSASAPATAVTTYCAGSTNAACSSVVTMCPTTDANLSSNTVTATWYFNGTLVYTDAAITPVSTASYTVTLPAGTFTMNTPGVYSGSNGLQVRLTSSQLPVAGCSASPVVGASTTITVVGPPGVISGSGAICQGNNQTLTNAAAGGTWSSSSSAIATVGASSGSVSGVSPGTAIITYTTAPNCYATKTVTVSAPPASFSIAGAAQVCEAASTNFTIPVSGGIWSSANSTIASVTGGTVSGVAAGNTVISYSLPTGCFAVKNVTVQPLPAAITGTAEVCVNSTTTLADATASGTWASSANTIATVEPSSGAVTGIAAGFASISYILPTGCAAIRQVTINPLPITTVSPATAARCPGQSASFTAISVPAGFSILTQDFNSGLGEWSVSNISGIPAAYWQITSSPATGIPGDGSAMLEANSEVAYTVGGVPLHTILTSPDFSTVGYATVTLAFNQYLISPPTDDDADVEYSIDGGASWHTVTSLVDVGFSLPGGGTGTWTASGTPEVSINLPAECIGQPTVRLRWNYNSNGGLYWDLDNIRVIAYQAGASFVWSGVGGATGLSCTACSTAMITPASVGTHVYSVAATTSSGCQSSAGATFTVNPLPVAIAGAAAVCVGAAATVTNSDPGGTWASGNAAVFTVDANSGVVTGVGQGTALITYTLPTGCSVTRILTVHPLPAAINGTLAVCPGTTGNLSNSTPGGTWTSANTAIATVSSWGQLSGVAAGNVPITYTRTSTGCFITAIATVNPLPASISGSVAVCAGATGTLTNADAGGTWSVSPSFIATVGAGNGEIMSTGVIGTATASYTLPTGCRRTALVTINPLPADITGLTQVCEGGATIALSNVSPDGTWSVTANASVDASGILTGISAGTATVTYTLPTGCRTTAEILVNPLPAAITGGNSVCVGSTLALANTSSGGTWASTAPSFATVSSAGVVSGIAAGSTDIVYTIATGCSRALTVAVNPLPAGITGVNQVCQGLTTVLNSISAGGAWTTGTTSVATVDGLTGEVFGLSAGTSAVTYQLPTGCYTTSGITVNPLPADIAGMDQICEGTSTIWTNASPGGSWSSSNSSIAAVDAADGTISAIAAGDATITYTLPTTCLITKDITVKPLPAAITGVLQLCEGSTANISSTPAGGTWEAAQPAVATVSAAGTVDAHSAGVTAVTYTALNGCAVAAQVTVNDLPATITGSLQVCAGLTGTLTSSGAGTWNIPTAGIAAVGASSGIVTASGVGTAAVTYTLPTGCFTTAELTVNAVPTPVTGTFEVCTGASAGLANATPGGTWSSSIPGVASVSATGVVSGNSNGTVGIHYTLNTGCKATAMVTVLPLPAPIAGTAQLCEGATGTLTNGSFGGMWISSTPDVATVSASGGIDAIASGTTLITYMLPTGCLRTRLLVVNPLPSNITGTFEVCQGSSAMLNNATPGGLWSSSMPAVAVVSASGLVEGIGGGTALMSYTLPTGCMATSVFTVNGLPTDITGSTTMCAGQSVMLTNGVAGGSWTSGSTAIATVDGATGQVTGITAGTADVTYTLPSGCFSTRSITVNANPNPITGATSLCLGLISTLTNTTPGGWWTSSAPGTANIGLTSGVVSGISTGVANISYTLLTGCGVGAVVAVSPMPAAISGPTTICNGQSASLSSVTTGGNWSTSDPAIADVSATGVVTATSAGAATISYSLPTGCFRTATVSVHPVPAVYNVTGGGHYCAGSTGVHVGLDGSNAGVNYQLYAGSTPIGLPLSGVTASALDFGIVAPAGTYSVVARGALTGCFSNMAGTATVVVNPLVTPAVTLATGTGRDSVCEATLTSFAATATGGGSAPVYVWKVNGATVGTATTAAYSYTPANGDLVTVEMTSSEACATTAMVTASKTITVQPNMMPVVNAVTPSTTLCSGSSVAFSASSMHGGSAPVYIWLKNGSAAGSGTSFTYIPADGDNVSVKMISSYACRLADTVASPSLTLAVAPRYVPVVTIAAHPGLTVTKGTIVTLTATVASGGPAPAYQWYIGTTAVSGATNATFTSSAFENNDSVSCEVTGTGICGMKTFNTVVIHHSTTGVSSVGSIADLTLVPNPNNGSFTVRGLIAGDADNADIQVTNVLGQVVYRTTSAVRNGVVDERVTTGALPSGVYTVQIVAGAAKHLIQFVLQN